MKNGCILMAITPKEKPLIDIFYNRRLVKKLFMPQKVGLHPGKIQPAEVVYLQQVCCWQQKVFKSRKSIFLFQ